MPNTFFDNDANVKTARMIGSVKTMSQVNERHDKHISIPNIAANDIGAYSSNHNHLTSHHARQSNETEQQYKKKLDANQQLIERLTGKPLSTQEFGRHTQGAETTKNGKKTQTSNQNHASVNMLHKINSS